MRKIISLFQANEKKANWWGLATRYIVIIYILIGFGYEIYIGLLNHHVGASLPLIAFSGCIFVGRVMYGLYSGARRTVIADVSGVIFCMVLIVEYVLFNLL